MNLSLTIALTVLVDAIESKQGSAHRYEVVVVVFSGGLITTFTPRESARIEEW